MALGKEMHNFLSKTIKKDAKTGILVNDLVSVFNFHLLISNSGIKINNGMHIPLIELYCICNKIEFSLDKKRSLLLIRGIAFKDSGIRDLADMLQNGLLDSTDVMQAAKDTHSRFYTDTT